MKQKKKKEVRKFALSSPMVLIVVLVIIILGYFLYQSKFVTTSQQTETSKTDKAANWKTYIGEEFSVKYPSDWIYKQISYQSSGPNDTAPSFAGVGFLPNSTKPLNDKYTTINIEIFNNPDKISLGDFVRDWYSFSPKVGTLTTAVNSGQDIQVDGLIGKKIINPPIDNAGLPLIWVLVPKNDKVFLFAVTLDKSYPEINKEKVFNQMLATFKFPK